MITVGSYQVKTVTLLAPFESDLCRVILICEGKSDVNIDTTLEQAPAPGTFVTLGWE